MLPPGSNPGWRGRLRAGLLPVFLFLGIGIGAMGYSYYQREKQLIERNARQWLSSVAALKVDQITAWRKARLGDAMVILENTMLAHSVTRWLQNPREHQLRRDIANWMVAVEKYRNYEDVLLLDHHGVVRLSARTAVPSESVPSGSLAAEAMRVRNMIMGEIYRDEASGLILLDTYIPVMPSNDTGPAAGVIVLRVDVRRSLFPQIQSWPTPSPTAETLAIRREGDQVVYLNDLRTGETTALRMRRSIQEGNLPAARAVSGGAGTVANGIDYRGVPVLAAMAAVPGSSWFLVAKVDQDEIYAPARNLAWWTTLWITLLVGLTGVTMELLWRRQQARHYRWQLEAEQERLALALRYDFLSRCANDIIFMLDHEGRIVEANDRALVAYGYTRGELLKLTIHDIRSPESPSFDVMWKELEQGRGSPFESLHRRKNGSPFPVEVSARIAELNGAKVVLSVVRDITERKRVEQAQRNLEESFMEVQEQERKRIARELHDETAQSMAALLAKLRSAEDSSTLEQAQERLKGLREHVRTAIDEVRRLAQRLQPKNLEDLGLPFALEQCAADYRKTYGLRVNMEMPGLRESGDLSTAVALALFRSLQEALTNVAKHAGATAVDIVVERRTDNILAIVEDNGCGFDANAGSPGLGLYGIRQRLSLLGGDLSIESEPGRGTSIYIQVPVECVRHE